MKCEINIRRWSWPNLRFYLYIYPEALRGTTNNHIQDNRSQGRNLKYGPPEAECYSILPQSLITRIKIRVILTFYTVISETNTNLLLVYLELKKPKLT
jgi:hypothetical protein